MNLRISFILVGSIFVAHSVPALAMFKRESLNPQQGSVYIPSSDSGVSSGSTGSGTTVITPTIPWVSPLNPWLPPPATVSTHTHQAKAQTEAQDADLKARIKESEEAKKGLSDAQKAKLQGTVDEIRKTGAEIGKKVEEDRLKLLDEVELALAKAKAKKNAAREALAAKIKAESAEGLKQLCFPGETPISVKDDSPNGYHSVPIASIHVGDSVVSCNLAGGTCEYGRVQRVITNTADRLIKLTFSGKILKATANHPFYVVDRKDWVEAQDLRVGDHLQSISGDVILLDDIQIEKGDSFVYNIDVQGNHNYYACDILVHNCNVAVAGTVAAEVMPAIIAGAELGAAAGPFGVVAGGMIAAIGGLAIGETLHKAAQPATNDGDAAAPESNKSEAKPTFEPNPKHGPVPKGRANPAPSHPQETLDQSVKVSENSSRRVGADKTTGEFNVFDEHLPGRFHGHSRVWGELTEAMKSALIKAKITNHKGKIL